tara:strand:+ start:342 stop:1634 length:1293 start_codon:yes stop_codon:yes gene_type:complete
MWTRALLLCALALGAGASSEDDEECESHPVFRVAFGSSMHQHKKARIMKSIHNMDFIDVFIFAGDAMHHDTPPCGMPWNEHKCERVDWVRQLYRVWTTADRWVRASFSSHRNLVDTWSRMDDYNALGKNHVRKIRGGHPHAPILATWDDHDYGEDDAGAEYAHKVESMRQFKDFWRNTEMDLEPRGFNDDDEWKKVDGVYRDYRLHGCEDTLDVQVILLDTRSHRTPVKRVGVHHEWKDYMWMWLKSYFKGSHSLTEDDIGDHILVDPDPGHTMLGDAQWAWFQQKLAEPAGVRVVVSSTQVLAAPANGFEAWVNFPTERDKLLDALTAAQKNSHVVVLSGDAHYSEVSVLETDDGKLYDFTASGLTEGWPWDHKNDNRHDEFGTFHANNFGVVEFRCNKGGTDVNFEVRDVDADVVVEMEVPLSDFTTM